MDIDIQKIFEDARKDPALLGTLNIQELLNNADSVGNYLEDKSLADITNDIYNIVGSLKISRKEKKEICDKLAEYRFVDEIYKLHRGKYLRWISKSNKLTNGGILVDIKFLDTGINILCKNMNNQFFQYTFDECLTFQKLSEDEILILMHKEDL